MLGPGGKDENRLLVSVKRLPPNHTYHSDGSLKKGRLKHWCNDLKCFILRLSSCQYVLAGIGICIQCAVVWLLVCSLRSS